MKFTEQDKSQIIDYLNLVATKAEFKLNTQDVIKYFKLLSFMQKELLPKVDANIFEVKKIIEPSEGEENS